MKIKGAFKPAPWIGSNMEVVEDKVDDGKKAGVGYEIKCSTWNRCCIRRRKLGMQKHERRSIVHMQETDVRNFRKWMSRMKHEVEWSAKD